ncbi:hypothetical protein [Aliiroseovarius sp.]|uniref:hypothetical protein n=1 Tax=Aliiroseovarius sp. TaxID=1872442 RepID=UPI003BAD560E
MKVLFLLMAMIDAWDLWEQPPRIRYLDAERRPTWAFYDFLLTKRDGSKTAVAIKPAAVVEATGFRQELELIRASTPLNFADDVALVTDRSFTASEARNAERLHDFRRHPDQEADQIVADKLTDLGAEVTIGDLASSTGLDGRGFRAAFRLIYSGVARVLDAGDITPQTRIIVGGAQ